MENDIRLKIKESLQELRNTPIVPENKASKMFDGINDYQYSKHKQLIKQIAIDTVPGYVWSEELGSIAKNLIYYFNGLNNDYNLNKSIALVGSYGVGKSILMRIFQRYLQRVSGGFGHPNIYRIVSIEDVLSHMSKPNYTDCELLYNYNPDVDRPMRKPANLMINEFGFRYDGKSFGTEYQELIEMFIMKRYDIFQESGKLTHVTTNCDVEDFKNIFHEKIMDRFKEMFNIIPVGGNSFRK